WYAAIQTVLSEEADSKDTLIDIGLKLAARHGGGERAQVLADVSAALRQMQDSLGVINAEAVYHFYPQGRKTITQQRGTASTFDPDLLADILDGPHRELFAKIRTLTTEPEFRLATPEALSDYREMVLGW